VPRIVYASEEERKAARREKQRIATAARRAKKAEEEGKEVKTRLRYATNEERIEANIQKQRKADKKRSKDRAEKREKSKEPWTPKFIGVDGESFITGRTLPNGEPEQFYCLLLRHDKEEIYNPDGLSTWDCLDYLTKGVPSKTALVGYFLNFDFECILKDLYQHEYKALQHGDEVSIYGDEYRLQWFVGKKLVIKKLYPSSRSKAPEDRKPKDFRMVTLQDVSGFFQSSFVSALKKWGFDRDERLDIITSGKAARGGFEHKNIEEVSKYNAMEMELLEELMMKVYESFKAGYQMTGLKFSVNANDWSGPGVFANNFLKQTNFADEHLDPDATEVAHFADEFKEYFGNEAALLYPYSLSYFGGRIELAAVGKFGKVYNYDINSAYPYALSLLPKWTPEDFKLYENVGHIHDEYGKELLDRRLMGMYGVRFNFPEGWTWYPFPVRVVDGGSPNVFYPRQGYTNVMSPELFAALDTLTEEELSYITITYAFVLEDSDGYGDALNRMDENRLCLTAKKTLEMADFRLQCKAAGKRLGKPEEKENDSFLAMAEKALKLILNSLYGKTVQQVGSHKYYNDFASAWITSTCRALLWRALAPEKASQNILMTMTDGIYSQVPLKFAEDRITTALGDWEAEDFRYFETFKPGIYRYESQNKKGEYETHYKVRGFLTPTEADKEALFSLIWEAVSNGNKGQFPSRQFMTRNLALIGWKNESYCRQFMTSTKIIESELKAKRERNNGSGWVIPEGKEHVFFRPKREHEFNDSKGYALDFENNKFVAEKEDDIDQAMNYWDSVIGYEDYYEAS
jgi:hypothetical protein